MARRLPPELKAKIRDSLKSGASVESVSQTFGVAERTVYYMLRQLKAEQGVRREFRVGRRSQLEPFKQQILELRASSPDFSMQEIIDALNLPVSPSALIRKLHDWNRDAK
jgi:transposase-like protein